MKFHWFHGMPWPHLPPDFRDRSDSVWVDVDSRYYDPAVGHRLYHEHLDPGWINAPGYHAERALRESGAATEAPPSPEPSFDERIVQGTLIGGSPDRVTEQVEDLVTRLRIGHLIGVFQFGDMPSEVTNRNTRLFAEHVIPRLRHLWSDYPDHWSPTPLQDQNR